MPLRTMTIIAAAVWLSACQQQAEERPAPMVVTAVVEPAEAGALVLSGVISARVDSPLAFRIGGQISERRVQRGQSVKRGQLLARLDPADLSLAAAQARAEADAADRAVAAARARATQSAADAERLAPLVGAGGVAAQTLEQAQAASRAAAAELAAAEQRARAARAGAELVGNNQGYGDLLADADGILADVLADAGAVVAPGQPVLLVARGGARDAVVAVPEAMSADIPKQAEARIEGDARRFAATLRELSGAADPVTRSFEARYALAGAEDVPPGRTVRLTFGQLDGAGSLMVPLAALVDRGRGNAVWVVTPDNMVRLQPVGVAAIRDDRAVVSSGLQPGQRVVALGAHLLSDGQAVRPGRLPQ